MKYGCFGLTGDDVCRLEVENARAILASYNATEDDINAVVDIIEDAYCQLGQSYASGYAVKRLFEEVTGSWVDKYFERYLEILSEEQRRYNQPSEEEEP